MNIKLKAERKIEKTLGLNRLNWQSREVHYNDETLNAVYLSYRFNDTETKIELTKQVFGDTVFTDKTIITL